MKKQQNNEELLHQLSHLPKKILTLNGLENTPEFVLHELAHKNCFNLKRAAFLVDSPDFNSLKGVAGFSETEVFSSPEHMWQSPHLFIDHMQHASFNQQVRSLQRASISQSTQAREKELAAIAHQLGFTHPSFHSWHMKYDNYGFFIYEQNDTRPEGYEEHLTNSLYLFSFCPIF